MEHEAEILAGTFKGSLISQLPAPLSTAYQRCAEVARNRIYHSKEVADIELSGYHIIYTLLSLMTAAVVQPEKTYSKLLLRHVSSQYEVHAPDLATRIMAVLDYLSGMTDVYAPRPLPQSPWHAVTRYLTPKLIRTNSHTFACPPRKFSVTKKGFPNSWEILFWFITAG